MCWSVTDSADPAPLTPEVIAETLAEAEAFLADIEAVPESGRVPMRSEKFHGPIGLPDEH